MSRTERKELILQTALALAAEGGWENVSIRKICDRLDLKIPLVYRVFKNKAEILWQISEYGHQQLFLALQDLFAEEQDFPTQMLAMSDRHFDFAMANKELYKLMYATPHPFGSADQTPQENLADPMIQYILGRVREYNPQISEVEAEEIFGGAMCLLIGYCLQSIYRRVAGDEANARKRMHNNMTRYLKCLD